MHVSAKLASALSVCLHLNRSSVLVVRATEVSLSRESAAEEKPRTAAAATAAKVTVAAAAAARWDISAGEASSAAAAEEHNDSPVVQLRPSVSAANEDRESAVLSLPSTAHVPQRLPPKSSRGSETGNGPAAPAIPASSSSMSTTDSASEHRGVNSGDAGFLPLFGEEQTATAAAAAAAFSISEQRELTTHRDKIKGEQVPSLAILGPAEQRTSTGETTIATSTTGIAASTQLEREAAGSARSVVGTIDMKLTAHVDVETRTDRKRKQKDDQAERNPNWSLHRGGGGSDSSKRNSIGEIGSGSGTTTITTATMNVPKDKVSDGRPSAEEPPQQQQQQRQLEQQRQQGFVVFEGREQKQQRQQHRRERRQHRRERQRQLQGKSVKVVWSSDELVLVDDQPRVKVRQEGGSNDGLMTFRLNGTTEALMPTDDAQDYLNRLVDRSAAAQHDQVDHGRIYIYTVFSNNATTYNKYLTPNLCGITS